MRVERRAPGWLIVRVVLLGSGGEELPDPPGRDLLVRSQHTFAELAEAIDSAFARWDLGHLHEFTLADGRRIVMADADEFDREAELDDRQTSLGSIGLRAGQTFSYVFDIGEGWEHRCTLLRVGVDPAEEVGTAPSEIVPVFGWGAIPDQYGRTSPDDTGE